VLTKQYKQAKDSLFIRTMYYHKAGPLPAPFKRNLQHSRFESIEKYNFNPFAADYKKALQQIQTPILLIGGRNDFIGSERYDEIKKIMKKAQVKVYICPTSAHFSMWDDPENYFRELNRFITSVNNESFNPGK
jgi:pimeloyl-ACP methyl ester carboxylesterase